MTAAGTPRPPRRRWWPAGARRQALLTAESALLGLVFGGAVVAPWAGGGYLLLLDWVSGPHQAITPGLYGLDPAALDALPFRLATQAVRRLVGPATTGWLMVLLYFPVAAGGVSALAGGGRWRRHPAALFAACNPFVVERIRAGHVPFLLSVALLGWLLAAAVRARRQGKPFTARTAGWYALAMSVAPHAAWLGGAALLAVGLLPRPRRSDLVRTLIVILSAGCVYGYAAVLLLGATHTVRVTEFDLDVYAPRAGPGGLLPTVASLHGFWRGTPGSPADRLGPLLGAVLLVVLLAAVVAGLLRVCRREPALGAPLSALAAAGLLLGAGVHGPSGGVYQVAFRTVPLFQVMREQQKWVALSMLSFAVAVGVAVEALAAVALPARDRATPDRATPDRATPDRATPDRATPDRAAQHPQRQPSPARQAPARWLAGGAVLAICAVYLAVAPSLVWGLGGTVQASRYPPAWYAADRIMGGGTGAVLFLPWHRYQPFGFTGGRTVAVPADAFFRRPVVVSDAVELGAVRTGSASRRSAYLDRLVADGGTGHFGRLIAPLGVAYVMLARDREAGAYAWLDRQADLRPVLRTRQLALYQVEPAGTGRVVASRTGGYQQAVALAGRGDLGTEALLPGGPAGGPVPSTAYGGISRAGSTRWHVRPGTPGWVVLPEEWSSGWRVAGRPGRPTAAGTTAFRVGPGPAMVEYAPWRWLRAGLAASLLSLAALVIAGLVEHRRDLANWWSAHHPHQS